MLAEQHTDFRFTVMKRYPRWFYIYLVLLFLLVLSIFCEPVVFLYGDGRILAEVPAIPGTRVSLCFLHSVQKTPVAEYLMVEKDGFRLLRTEYQSFGVGLPFLASEGDFRAEGDFFVMDHMDRHFPSEMSFRTGVGTRLVFRIKGKEYRLYEMYPPGTRVDLRIEPLYRKWIRT